MGDSLYSVRHELADLVGDLPLLGVVSSAASGVLVDNTNLVEPDDDWEGAYLYVYSAGSPAVVGQERTIASFASHTLGVATNWTMIPASGDKYELHRTWKASQYDRFIKMAYRSRRKRTLLPAINASIVLLADTYEYTIYGGLASVYQVWKRDDGGDYSIEIPLRDLWIDRANKKLCFDKTAAGTFGYITASRTVRVVGQKYDTIPTSDASEFSINTTPLIWLAKAYLHASEGNDASMKAALAAAQIDAEDDDTPMWPGSLRVEEA